MIDNIKNKEINGDVITVIYKMKKTAFQFGLLFLFSYIIESFIFVLFNHGQIQHSLFLIVFIAIELLKSMYSTLFCYSAADYNKGPAGLWFVFALFFSSIALLCASTRFILKKEYKGLLKSK
jgi:hypothetical protein